MRAEGIGQLDLAPSTGFLCRQMSEHFRLQDVAADDGQTDGALSGEVFPPDPHFDQLPLSLPAFRMP